MTISNNIRALLFHSKQLTTILKQIIILASDNKKGLRKMELNDRIKMLMEEKGLTQKELSQMANITEASMSKYLSGVRTPRIDVIVNIANALEVSVDSLLGGANSTINGLMDAKLVLARGKDTLSEDDKKELIKFLLGN